MFTFPKRGDKYNLMKSFELARLLCGTKRTKEWEEERERERRRVQWAPPLPCWCVIFYLYTMAIKSTDGNLLPIKWYEFMIRINCEPSFSINLSKCKCFFLSRSHSLTHSRSLPFFTSSSCFRCLLVCFSYSKVDTKWIVCVAKMFVSYLVFGKSQLMALLWYLVSRIFHHMYM